VGGLENGFDLLCDGSRRLNAWRFVRQIVNSGGTDTSGITALRCWGRAPVLNLGLLECDSHSDN
jgi:hypothetical protein